MARALEDAGFVTVAGASPETVTAFECEGLAGIVIGAGDRPLEDVRVDVARLRPGFPGHRIILVAPPERVDEVRAAPPPDGCEGLVEVEPEERLIEALGAPAPLVAPTETPGPLPAPAAYDTPQLLDYRAFSEMLAGLRAVCRRRGEPLTIAVFDLDRFRTANADVSLCFGDRVLQWFLAILRGSLRRGDLLMRMHVDRFLVAFPRVRAAQGHRIAARCQQLMRDHPLAVDGRTYEITASVGLVECSQGFIESEHQLIYRARLAMEHGKHLGGNRVVNWLDLADHTSSPEDLRKMNVNRISHWMRRAREEVRQTCLETTLALVAAVEAKDPYTRAHSMTVADYAEAIGREMKLNEPMMATLRAAALLHDVGKIGVPDAILTKPTSLTAEEYEIIKRHPRTALDILEHVSFVAEERPLILHHHERHDGMGYPSGLSGDQIPIGARVLAAADAIDAMLSPRSYKKAYSLERVTEELRLGAGKQFDPAVAETALRWLRSEPHQLRMIDEAHAVAADAC